MGISQRNGNLHAPPLDHDTTESDEENSSDENEISGYELLPQNDIPNLQEDDGELEDENSQTLDDILRQIQPSQQVQTMIEESQRTQDREVIQEREALFNQ